MNNPKLHDQIPQPFITAKEYLFHIKPFLFPIRLYSVFRSNYIKLPHLVPDVVTSASEVTDSR